MSVGAPFNYIAPRSPSEVMRLDRLGSTFPTRLSFMRILLRRMAKENWKLSRPHFNIDAFGFGCAIYTISSSERSYSLIAFSQYLDPVERMDRVIAKAWDATFVLYDGIPSEADIKRLRREAPKQEEGRYGTKDLVLSRANKSVRLFEHVVQSLSKGKQPDRKMIAETGYLMRTTAVYANGKFGLADRTDYANRPALTAPFQAEMLTVYLIRCFTFDLVEHVARSANPIGFTPLANKFKRYLGIGNATGLGMAPFLVNHPTLIHNWFHARETALARVRAIACASEKDISQFRVILKKAIGHVAEWNVEDDVQTSRIHILRGELKKLMKWKLTPDIENPWDQKFQRAMKNFSLEGQEILVSILMELYPEIVDPLAEELSSAPEPMVDPNMSISEVERLLDDYYDWAFNYDFGDKGTNRFVWYYSDEKLEPRRGEYRPSIAEIQSISVAIARDIQSLKEGLKHEDADTPIAIFLLRHPNYRNVVCRVQNIADYPYSELQGNLIGTECRPIDILRAKLAYFGASKFDPKSDLWTRITMYQGAPLPSELTEARDCCFPTLEA